jgi:hypothetical protein
MHKSLILMLSNKTRQVDNPREESRVLLGLSLCATVGIGGDSTEPLQVV